MQEGPSPTPHGSTGTGCHGTTRCSSRKHYYMARVALYEMIQDPDEENHSLIMKSGRELHW